MLINGYWHARSSYLSETMSKLIEWIRLPGDLVFGMVGVLLRCRNWFDLLVYTEKTSPILIQGKGTITCLF